MKTVQGGLKVDNQSEALKINSVLQIDINKIEANPNQPRKEFDEISLMELAHSIYQNGILQPISVRQNENGSYEIIAGERRYRAAIIAGLKEIPCIIIDADERQAALFSLIENIQRHDLSFFEEAKAIQRLISYYGLSQEEAAKKLGKAQSTLSNKLRILKLPEEIQSAIIKFGMTERHARALLKLEDEKKQQLAVKIIVEKRLNVSQTENLIERMLEGPKPKQKIIMLFKDVRIFVDTINNAISMMKESGIKAESSQTETENYIEYTVRIPKEQYGKVKYQNTSAV